MPQNSIKLNSNFARWLLLVPAAVVLLGAITGFCWFFGDSIAASAEQPDIAEAAARLAPADPLPHGKIGLIKSQSFVPTDLPDALAAYEEAARRAPHDWRYWLALGRMHERLGNAARAEAAARRAVELAPNYAQTRWLLGNVLLRGGKTAEALAEMRRAAEADPVFAVHYLNTAAQTLDLNDQNGLQKIGGDSAAIRATLVSYLIGEKKLDQAMSFWEKLPDNEKQSSAPTMSDALIAAGRIRAALPIYTRSRAEDADAPMLGKIVNPSFDGDTGIDVGEQHPNIFYWHIPNGSHPNIGFDTQQKQHGARSLILIFDSPSGAEFRNVFQFVPVESNTNYRLSLFVKTANLASSSTMQWHIADNADKRLLAATPAIAANSTDWQPQIVDFKTGAATEAITITLARMPCGLPPCSISGKVWFDNFSLQKVSK